MSELRVLLEDIAEKAQYDENAKDLLSHKPFLANILVNCVEDFQGMAPEEVEQMIEGKPSVSTPVEPGFTNEEAEDHGDVLRGMNTESKVRGEGVLFFDIIFYVRTKDGRSKVIVNIESQKDEPSAYDVEMRGIFYVSREISSQLNREFKNQRYNDICKVYSIWLIMNASENQMARIHLAKEDIIGESRWKPMYDVFNLVLVRLKDVLDSDMTHRLHRLVGALFLPDMSFEDKNKILEEEFHIKMEGERKEMLERMCNLGQGIEERAMRRGVEQGIEQGIERGIRVLILNAVEDGKPEEVILSRIINGFEMTRDKAKAYYEKYALGR